MCCDVWPLFNQTEIAQGVPFKVRIHTKLWWLLEKCLDLSFVDRRKDVLLLCTENVPCPICKIQKEEMGFPSSF